MSEPEFDLYLSLLSKFLRLNSAQKADIAEELRVHLEDRLAELTALGKSRDEAIRLALEEFGDAGALAWQFTLPHHVRRRRLIMRYSIGSFAAVAGIFCLVSLNWPTQPDQPPHGTAAVAQADVEPEGTTHTFIPAQEEKRDEEQEKLRNAIEAKLLQRDYEFHFVDLPWNESLQALSELLEVDILLDHSAGEGGAQLDALITLETRKGALSMKTALELILRKSDDRELTYVIKDGIILITRSDEEFEVQVYDCRDLLQGTIVQNPVPMGVMGGGFGGGGGGFFSVPAEAATALAGQLFVGGGAGREANQPAPDRTAPISTSTAGAALIRVLQSATHAKWVEFNGDGGSISEFDGMLIVRHNQNVHRKIAELLEKLRKTKNQHLQVVLKQTETAPPLQIPAGKRLVTLNAGNWQVPINAIKPGARVDVVRYSGNRDEVPEVILTNAVIVLPNLTPITQPGLVVPTAIQVNSVSLIVTPEEALELQQTEFTSPVPLKFLLRGEEPTEKPSVPSPNG